MPLITTKYEEKFFCAFNENFISRYDSRACNFQHRVFQQKAIKAWFIKWKFSPAKQSRKENRREEELKEKNT